MEQWEFQEMIRLLEEANRLLREILCELKKDNPPPTFDLPGTTAKMTRV
jgi:hypothetical protein